MSTPIIPDSTADENARISTLLSQFGDASGAVQEIVQLSLQQAMRQWQQEHPPAPPAAPVTPVAPPLTDPAVIAQAVSQGVAAAAAGRDLPLPASFEGKIEDVEPFLSRAKDYLAMKEAIYPTPRVKILWALFLFKGPRAEAWASGKRATLTSETDPDPYDTFAAFEADVRDAFGGESRILKARISVDDMEMKPREPLGDFVNRFRLDADVSRFNDDTLIYFFRRKVPGPVQLAMLSLRNGKAPDEIKEWYKLCREWENVRISTEAAAAITRPPPPPRPSFPPATAALPPPRPPRPAATPDAMDVDGHRVGRRCYNCNGTDHLSRACPHPRRTRNLRAATVYEIEELENLRARVRRLEGDLTSNRGNTPEELPQSDFLDGQQ